MLSVSSSRLLRSPGSARDHLLRLRRSPRKIIRSLHLKSWPSVVIHGMRTTAARRVQRSIRSFSGILIALRP
ncbi:hypothetical protein BD309DRAFT_404517 [Dichomitus squalens]|uniref:Uncharacterized protein n=1 Tax=Dichomitus squalens TaxID=114155 RepID=A0A4Q9PRY3_9APHY|nr:hypothetical protein BD309DRAFT_404517 [Dichomitus squalens]TBU57150.1 hypothetical protein BD310DRAFT_570304 [Dichomitus squalens]